MGRWKGPLLVLGLSVVLGLFFKRDLLSLVADTGNGYGAKIACSLVFVANRSLQSVLDAELTFPPVRFLSSLATDGKCVTASWRFWPQTRTACWKSRELGCSLVFEGYTPEVPPAQEAAENWARGEEAWPRGDRVDQQLVRKAQEGVRLDELGKVIQAHFNDTRLHARAVLVIRSGQIIYEQYGDGAAADTPLLGWSMTKSVINALVAILVKEGRLSLDSTAPFPEWANDDRSTITIREMLHMSDGLDFDEVYAPAKDAPTMLFTTPNTLDTVLPRGLRLGRAERRCSAYSSATTNLLSRLLRMELGKDYLGFPRKALFGPLGMRQALMETDAGGTFVGSSFGWASARDWARFGLLYANDGLWPDGKGSLNRILPEGWVNFTATPVPSADNVYGAHFWLGGRQPETERAHIKYCDAKYPTRTDPPRGWVRQLPFGTFFAHGFEEQMLAIVPSKDTVVVRLGATKEVVLKWQKPEFYSAILNTIPDIAP